MPDDTSVDQTAEVKASVIDIVSSMAPDGSAAVLGQTTLVDEMGFDSAGSIELIGALERHFSCVLDDDEANNAATTVDDICALVLAAVTESTDAHD